MRIGAFFFDSSEACLVRICERTQVRLPATVCYANRARAITHKVRQVILVHIELFLSEEYQNGSWEYEQIGHRDIKKHADGASGGIFDTKYLKDAATSELTPAADGEVVSVGISQQLADTWANISVPIRMSPDIHFSEYNGVCIRFPFRLSPQQPQSY
ncbi:hypothetical protein POM88_032822 [Heracleum sosnowskyi]|uniref:Uncharacterized protein n=1 Tax=Heracleum sosnowskyi TaxID=360622 RepID=A0AAD8I031_9APIA|nr:hypothetical protein POM88_032822 [Heracleum sosnowskyi]